MGQNFAKHVGFTRPNVEAASLKFGSVTILNYGVARDLRQMAHSLKLLIVLYVIKQHIGPNSDGY